MISVNPYRQLPIYTDEVVRAYLRSKRKDAPPHIFAVADEAYRKMMDNRENQSILITGESGAGKTENTKKVIQYLSAVSADKGIASEIDEKLLAANPILEAFGNAQTVKNNNSSRFGKFVKIEFNTSGQICSASIERYLLEKSRVTHHSEKERSFHVFYQFIKGAPLALKERFFITGKATDYAFLKKSNQNVSGVDDAKEFNDLIVAFETMQFSDAERDSFFRIVAVILLMGNMQFLEEGGRARFAETTNAERVCQLLGVSMADFSRALLTPQIKAGRDWVVQDRDLSQVAYSVEALCRAMYDRMFGVLVDLINRSLEVPSTKANFIGVLDIAGFEIFDLNSFEQLCINYTNEKLQQFFNHHMFVQEQEEYRREKLDWKYVDFGLDLQPVIDLIEKCNPIGVLPCLDEECVMPKATDRTFSEKLEAIWKGKGKLFEADRFGGGFAIHHYAGRVFYNINGWLDKNKDPLNENITRLLAQSTVPFVAGLFEDYFGNENDIVFMNKCKKGAFRTVSQRHREQLVSLMNQLNSTSPHFIRCILPNHEKRPDHFVPRLVVDQLRCNGVLEGIRVTRQGFPNRLYFGDFVRRYEVLLPASVRSKLSISDSKAASQDLLNFVEVDQGKYCIGLSKVFFRAGALAELEDARDQQMRKFLTVVQASIRMAIARSQFLAIIRNSRSIQCIQQHIKAYLTLQRWPWWKLFVKLRPLMKVTRVEEEITTLTKTVFELRGSLTAEQERQRQLEALILEKERDLKRSEAVLAQQSATYSEQSELLQAARIRQASLEEDLKIAFTENENQDQLVKRLQQELLTTRSNLAALEKSIADLNGVADKNNKDRTSKSDQIDSLMKRAQDDAVRIQNLARDKKFLQDQLQAIENDLMEKTKAVSASKQKGVESTNKVVQLEEKIADLNQKLLEAARYFTECESDFERRTVEFKHKAKEAESEVLQLRIKAEESVQQLETLRKDSQSRLQKKDAELEELRMETAQCKTKFEKDITQLQSLVQRKGDEHAQKSQVLEKMKKDEVSSLQSKINELSALKISLSKQCEDLTYQVEKQQHEMEALLSSKLSLEKLLAAANSREEEFVKAQLAYEKQIRAFEQEIVKLGDLTRDQQQSLERETQEHALLQERYQSVAAALTRAEKDLSFAQSNISSLKRELEETVQVKMQLETAKRASSQESVELQRKLDDSEIAHADAAQRLKDKNSDFDRLKQKHAIDLEDLNRSRKASEKELQTALLKIEELTAALFSAEKSKHAIQGELEDYRLEHNGLLQDSRTIEKNSRAVEAQLIAARNENEQLQSQYDELERLYRNGVKSFEIASAENERICQLLKNRDAELVTLSETLEEERKEIRRKERAHASASAVVPSDSLLRDEMYCSRKMYDETVERYESKIALLAMENSQLATANDRLKSSRTSFSADDAEATVVKLNLSKLKEEVAQLQSLLIETTESSKRAEQSLNLQISQLMHANEALHSENLEQFECLKEQSTKNSRLLEELDNRSFELENANLVRKSLLAEAEELRKQLQADFNSRTEEVGAKRRLQSEIQQLQAAQDQLISERDQVEAKLSLATSKIQSLLLRVDVLEHAKEQVDRSLSETRSANLTLVEEVEVFKSHRTSQLEKVKRLEEVLKNQQESFSALEQKLATSEADLRKTSEFTESNTFALRQENSQKTELIKKLEARLQNECQQLSEKLDRQYLVVEKLREQLSTADERELKLRDQLESQSSSLTVLKKDRERLDIRLDDLSTSNQQLREGIEQKDRQFSSMMATNRELRFHLESQEENVVLLERQKKQFQERIASLEDALHSLQHAQPHDSQAPSSGELLALKSLLDSTNEELRTVGESFRRSEERCQQLMRDVSIGREQSATLEREKISLDRLLKDQQKKLLDLESAAHGSQNARSFEEELFTLRNQLEALFQERTEILRDLRKSERSLVDSVQQRQELEHELATAHSSLQRSETKFQRCKEQLDELQTKEADSSIKIKRSSRLSEQQSERIKQLEEDILRYKANFRAPSISFNPLSRTLTPTIAEGRQTPVALSVDSLSGNEGNAPNSSLQASQQ